MSPPALPAPAAPPATGDGLRAVVVVPARDEEGRIGRCIAALAAQEGLVPGSWEVVLVLDGCTDATEAVARAAAGALPLHVVAGPARGVGFARRAGMATAADRIRAAATTRVAPCATQGVTKRPTFPGTAGVLASTDADTVVAPDWLARILAAVAAGAGAVGGRIVLDAEEAEALPPAVLVAREHEATARLAAVRGQVPGAEHHQFSGASLALTLEAHDRVGGLPAVATLEDEALERALRAAGVPVAYRADVRATTSARTVSHVPHGLAQVLRTTSWRARQGTRQGDETGAVDADLAVRPDAAAVPDPTGLVEPPGAPGTAVLVLRPDDGRRGDAVHAARAGAADDVDVVVVLGPGVSDADAQALAARLRSEPELVLVRAAEPEADPLGELVARPALNLHAPELAVVRSPLTRSWAIRRRLLDALSLPHGDAVDLSVLLDAAARHGLDSVAEQAVAAPPRAARADGPLAAYALLALVEARTGDGTAAHSSAFADPSGVRRAELSEHAPSRASRGAGPPG